jgi:hypothetical protein
MMFTKSMILFSFSGLFGLMSSLVLADSKSALTAEQFEKLRALIKPHLGEDKWAEIPWSSQLWEARRQAATQGKPILLWEMDGNPLGCG